MLESVLTEQDTSKREVGILRELLEKAAMGWDTQDPQQSEDKEQEGRFANGGSGGGDGKDGEDIADARSIRTIVPHELERVE